jgi:hypothetical protein
VLLPPHAAPAFLHLAHAAKASGVFVYSAMYRAATREALKKTIREMAGAV